MAVPRRRYPRSVRRHDEPASRRSPSLAKLTRPRLDAPYPRQRLFTVLDGVRGRPVVWIAGPPGAGKTTLAATWVEARRLPGIWYQLDPGDSDPATFFYYLKRAAEAACGARGASLPLLTAEYRRDVPAFARRWFRDLFAILPAGSVLALDNYQELAAESTLHRALAAACNEIAEGCQLVVMSWGEPPPDFSRALAQERLARVEAEALRLTAEEAEGIAAGKQGLTAEQIRELHAQCRGWAAGFTLLRERTRRTGLVNDTHQHATMQEVFDYFVAMVFRDAPPESREALLKTALLPRFTERMALAMSGDPRAGEVLESFCRRHLFVDRRHGAAVTYEYHALFRAFLLDQARRHYTAPALAELSRRATAVLEEEGWHEEALEVSLRSGDHAGAAILLERLAPGLVAAGRGATLAQAFNRLPPAVRDGRPGLSYWLGAALTYANVPDARAAFERAYRGFLGVGDRAGQAMAVAGVLQLHNVAWSNSMNDLAAIQRWVAIFEPLLEDEPVFPSPDIAMRVYAPVIVLTLWHLPRNRLFPICVERLEALLEEPFEDADVKAWTALGLMEYYAYAGYVHDADRIIAAIEPLVRGPRVSPVTRAFWWFHSSRRDGAVGDLEAARRRLRDAVAIAAEEQSRGSEAAALVYFYASMALAAAALDLGDLDAVPPVLASMRPGVASGGPQALAGMHWVQARLAASHGDLDGALQHAEQACSLSGTSLILAGASYGVTLASILIECRERGRAREVLDRIRGILPADRFPAMAIRVDLLDGLLGAAADRDWRARITDAIRHLHALGAENPLQSQPLATRQVAELLLSEGIEVPYVRAWIRRLNPRPSRPDVPCWPWAIRVRTLGDFRIEMDDRPLTFGGKAPRKPLQLLQLLIALGGAEVSAEAVCQALWPDSEGDAADAALRVTLSRLRALLRHEAIVLKQGRLSLDGRLCWIDLWSFRDVCRGIDRRPADSLGPLLLDVYRGPFLAGEREEPWMLPVRERLRRQFAAAVAAVGTRLEHDGLGGEASAFRRNAEERDPHAFARSA